MLTDLEKYLASKRKALDIEAPDDQRIWKGIRKNARVTGKMTVSRHIPVILRIRDIAAIVFILFSLGYITKDLIGERIFDSRGRLSDYSKISGEKESGYKTVISLKTDEVRSLNSSDNLIIKELFSEIDKLNIVYEQSLKDLREIGYNERIVNTIFDTYEKKIQLLELIILESNKPVSYENNSKIRL